MPYRWILFILPVMLFGTVSTNAASDGVLTVKTQPDGVEVWLDDKYVGDTPVMEKKLKPGKYTIKLIDAVRHTSSTEEVFIQAGQTTLIEKTMKSKFGSLNVNSKPEGAEVYVLLPLGKTPVNNDYMKPGKYRLEVRHPNSLYKKVSEDITISEGEKVDVAPTLQARNVFDKKAMLRIGLGAGAIAGLVYGLYEHGNYKQYEEKQDLEGKPYTDEIRSSNVKRVLGIVAGSLCVVGFEIVAFF